MKLFTTNKTFNEYHFEKEFDFEREVVGNSKLFFGQKTIYIDAKKKIGTKNLGNSIPDGLLFDLSNKQNPEFYLVEVELAKHDFYNHIFPQITKFFGFFKNAKSLNELVEKIFYLVNNDIKLTNEFKKLIGEREIYKFIKDTLEKSQNVLLILDGDKKELPEITETYSDTWGKMVKILQIKKFVLKKEEIYTMHPEFEEIEFSDIEENYQDNGDSEYTESFHLDGVSENIKVVYNFIKKQIKKKYPKILFNPQKYYISIKPNRNLAFFIFRRKKILLIVMNSEKDTKTKIKHHFIRKLTPGIQKFYNGPSCGIRIESDKYLNEIVKLLLGLIAKSK